MTLEVYLLALACLIILGHHPTADQSVRSTPNVQQTKLAFNKSVATLVQACAEPVLNAPHSITSLFAHALKVTQEIPSATVKSKSRNLCPTRPTLAILPLAVQTPNATTEYALAYQNTKEILMLDADPNVSSTSIVLETKLV